ncbi:hypothetical protein [Succinivibrio dextrinosolvens]|uniref:Uncharacterized protein n=1 Tax=Succinivibrio dextrinosolvens TaxID=83771 RepID=A0A662ZD78_9GAMM|nr:hypothetical protein [Succinivibrio dextrinosolvens]SFK54601.1 hypothetical protein SAMN04487865_11073 [Succinivibrio dextrinosolvens]
MLTSINAKGFCKYENLNLEKLRRINFILGRRNIAINYILNVSCYKQNQGTFLDAL